MRTFWCNAWRGTIRPPCTCKLSSFFQDFSWILNLQIYYMIANTKLIHRLAHSEDVLQCRSRSIPWSAPQPQCRSPCRLTCAPWSWERKWFAERRWWTNLPNLLPSFRDRSRLEGQLARWSDCREIQGTRQAIGRTQCLDNTRTGSHQRAEKWKCKYTRMLTWRFYIYVTPGRQ